MKISTLLLAVCISILVCSPLMAHPLHGVSGAEGLLAGLSHPWLGMDHLLAMIAVGVLSVQLGGRALWLLPTLFLALMTVGGAIGMGGVALPITEVGIALSVVVLGAALAYGRKYPLLAAGVVIGACGLLHGHAHGTEIPAVTAPTLYAAGFVLATAALHLSGVLAGKWLLQNKRRVAALRVSGAAISCIGMLLLLGMI